MSKKFLGIALMLFGTNLFAAGVVDDLAGEWGPAFNAQNEILDEYTRNLTSKTWTGVRVNPGIKKLGETYENYTEFIVVPGIGARGYCFS